VNLVSIIIVNYNGKALLDDCILSIRKTEASESEIIIVDNASTDDSCNYIRNKYPFVKLIELNKNYGFAKANNVGALYASGEFLIFLNSDTVVTKGWLYSLLEVMLSDPSIGAVGSKLMLYNLPGTINSAGANIIFNGNGYDIGFMDRDKKKYNVRSHKGSVCAASMMVRKKEFLDLDGFDPLYFMYFEDVDLCWRYWIAGFKVVYVPDSIVYHHFGGTTGPDLNTPNRVFYSVRNCYFNIIKNYELKNLFFPVLFNIFFHIYKFLTFVSSFKLKAAVSILKAYKSLKTLFPEITKKRKKIQSLRKIDDNFMFEHAIIVKLPIVLKEFLRLRKAPKINHDSL
jgi:GT2 family glycosyltransferase